jgi:hypothetical protein
VVTAGDKNNGCNNNGVNNYLAIGKRIQVFFAAKPEKINQRKAKYGARNFVQG